jgi:PAS domain S-box-containing protein
MSSGNLSEADKRCRAAFGLASTAMAFISPGGSFIDVNSGLCSLFGYRDEDFSGMAFLDLFPAEHQKGALSRLRALVVG